MKISNHAKRRIVERTYFNHRERKQLFRNALDKGKSVKQIKDKNINKYLASKQTKTVRIKLYKDYVFVYGKNSKTLYTMYKLPENLVGKEK